MRGVGYVKRSGLAGHRCDTWGQMEGHLVWWNREIAAVRIHGTTGEQPLVRFQRDEADYALAKALNRLDQFALLVTSNQQTGTAHGRPCQELI